MKTIKRALTIALTASTLFLGAKFTYSQDSGSGYTFTMTKQVKTTPVKNQLRTEACWSYAVNSLLESELIRMGQPEYDFSELFFINYAFAEKASLYVRYVGTNNFGRGGQAHDVLNLIRKYGITTDEAYPDNTFSRNEFLHEELWTVLKADLDAVIKNPNEKISTLWYPALVSVIDKYFGPIPTDFLVNGKNYTPKTFFESTRLNLDNYVEITSFNHHPFYQSFILETPDNWSREKYFNLPLNDFIAVIDNSIMNGYSVCWNGDVSEKGFAFVKGMAILPASKYNDLNSADMLKWADVSEKDRISQRFTFNSPVPEINVTQENRQLNFDNQTTSDDHLMHIVGIAKDQNGAKYYYTKNSWGTEYSPFKGYMYMSEPYLKMKTVAIMVHKDAIPSEIAVKLGIIKVRGFAQSK
jgi:bleomycin hydrolase